MSAARREHRTAFMASGKLSAAARLIGDARAERLLAADQQTAQRLALLGAQVRDHAEMLEEHGRNLRPIPTTSCPPGKTIGWLLRHDAATRATRRAAGLTVPEEVKSDAG